MQHANKLWCARFAPPALPDLKLAEGHHWSGRLSQAGHDGIDIRPRSPLDKRFVCRQFYIRYIIGNNSWFRV